MFSHYSFIQLRLLDFHSLCLNKQKGQMRRRTVVENRKNSEECLVVECFAQRHYKDTQPDIYPSYQHPRAEIQLKRVTLHSLNVASQNVYILLACKCHQNDSTCRLLYEVTPLSKSDLRFCL